MGIINLKFKEIKLPVMYDNIPAKRRYVIRNEYAKRQDGLCYYCKAPLKGKPTSSVLKKKLHLKSYPKHFFRYPVHLHHSHVTGLTIGAVHCYCNAVLWEHHGE